MRRVVAGLCGVVAMAPAGWAGDVPAPMPVKAAPAEVVAQNWTVTMASEARYYSWKSDRGSPTNVNTAPGSGSQWYVPFAVQVAGKPVQDFKVQVLARGGWVRSQQSTAGLSGAVETFTDTVISGTVTYLGIDGIQPFVSLNVNAPTGQSALFGGAANARMDPDLVEIGSFGEGWNIGPTVGFNLPITPSLMFTGSVGYTWRGRFDRERSSAEINPAIQTPTGLDPGDVLTGTAAIGYQDPTWSWNVTGTLSEETATTENGAALYRGGRRYLATASVAHTWPDQWGQTTLNGSVAHSNRNDVLFAGASALVAEAFSTSSDMQRIGVQHLFVVSQNFVVGPTGSYLHRNSNHYDAGTLQFVPAKERWAAGGMARVAVNDNVTLNLRGEHVWTSEDERTAPNGQQFSVLLNQFVAGSAVPVVSSTGWMVAGGANVKF
jgi:hypothetical protein